MKVVFLGTPQFAVNALRELHKHHCVVGVVCQPDKAKDRKGNIVFGKVKQTAIELNIPVLQFSSIKTEGASVLKELDADVFVTCAYGQILNEQILSIPRYGTLNIHASLLPKYRGSAPVQWAIINGEKVTGVTIMRTELGLDTGDIVLKASCEIMPDDTCDTLLDRLSVMGAQLILRALSSIEDGTVTYTKQDEAMATKCSLITKQTGFIDFNDTAENVYNRVRAVSCYTYIDGEYTKLIKVSIVNEFTGLGVGEFDDLLRVGCKSGSIAIDVLQPQNKRQMTSAEYLLGRKNK